MSVADLLSRLGERGIQVRAVGDRLRVSAPPGALTDELQTAIARYKQELLSRLTLENLQLDEVEGPKPLPSADRLQLSYAQQRLWIHDQLAPGNPGFNIATATRLHGELDVAALEESLARLAERHESLRTVFVEGTDGPVQVIHAPGPVALPLTDLGGNCTTSPLAEARRAILEEFRRPMDLRRGPLFRAHLLRLASEDHVLLFVLHHIIADGWSIGVLNRDLTALYDTCRQQPSTDLPELPLQYADFATWQRRSLESGPLENLLEYWRPKLSSLRTLDLLTDHVRPAVQTYRGGQEDLLLPPTLTEGLDNLGRENRATLFMTLLAAFKVLLYRYSGQEDIAVGSPIAGRTRSEVEDLIGSFVNTLVLRTDLSGDLPFRELLSRVRRSTVEALQHQDLPFDKLVEELDPPRDLSRSPLFQVFFALQNAHSSQLQLTGLSTSPVEFNQGTTPYDLSAYVWKEPETLRVRLFYDTDLFEPDTIKRMLRAYCVLLEGIVERPDQTVSELALLSHAERRRTLTEWNATTRAGREEVQIQTLFEQQALENPDSVAVEFEGRRLTYGELDRRANQLAHHLREHGVGPEVPVGICVDRGLEMLVGLLGILKAGGAYVPLDPDYPSRRLERMLEQTRAPVLLTQERRLHKLSRPGLTLVCLDTDDRLAIARQPTHAPDRLGTPENLAYVIFTSGSTGRPRGVQISHAAVVNFLRSMARRPGVDPDDVLLAVTTLSFDIAVLELLLPLTVGARVAIASKEVASDGYRLREALRTSKATVMQATPATWQMLLQSEWPGEPGLKTLCGGETLPRTLADQLLERGAELWNLYGPTETTVWSALEQVERGDGPVPLGRPIDNTRLYVLDSRLEPVPQGIAGELYIGGEGLARGYLNRDEQAAERFVTASWDAEHSERLYRTGDLARYDGRGRLRFLGRTDHQVKIRGYRIELGEIETALSRHAGVEQATVLVRGEADEKRLVAWITTTADGTPSTGELREFLRDRLPDYMVPTVFVTLNSMPLTSSGKVDRLKLAETQVELESPHAGDVGPRSPEEESVAAAFVDVLDVERIGVHDNFFELGGHSLLATRLVSRLRGIFRVELPLRTVFESPTVAQLCERIRQLCELKSATCEPMQPVPRDGETIELSFAQRRLWMLDQMGVGAAYNMHRTFRLRGVLDPALLERAINAVVVRHEALRTCFVSESGVPRQVIEETVAVPLEQVDLSGLSEGERDREVQQRISEDAGQAFDLSRVPLLRTTLLRTHGEEHLLLVTMHHIACDFWSTELLARDLGAFCRAFLEDEEPDLPELQVQYADFASWQNARLQGELLETQLEYWKQQLGGELPVLNLPTDRPRPAVQTFSGACHWFPLSASLTASLKELARERGVTLAMVLLAAYQTLLSRYTGQEDLIVGSPIANRTHTEVEELIGFFVNSLVLRADLSGDPTFSKLLERVQRSSLEAYDHQDLPFERLVYELDPERDLSQNPLFQVVFAMQNVPRSDLVLPGLVIEPVRSPITTTRFDLELYMLESTGGLTAQFVYNTDLFDASTIERMAGHLQSLLEGVARDPEAHLSRLPLLDEEEQRQLTVTWNATAAPYPRESCIQHLFEEQAAKSPDSVAVVYGDRRLTYAELNHRANRLAHHLIGLGVGSGTLVGLCVERGLDMVVGTLGILKAGGAYVPLDTAYPEQRLAFMLEDTQTPVLLTEEALADRFVDYTGHLIRLDFDREQIATASDDNPTGPASADDLAYVIYTSGSTGQSKGVCVPHRAVCRLVLGTDYVELSSRDRIAQASNASFDAATFEIWGALLTGARLVGLEQDVALSPHRFAEAIREEGITVLFVTTALFNQLAVQAPGCFKPLRYLLFGGEAVDPAPVRAVLAHDPPENLLHVYGPTENTTFSTWYPVEEVPDDARTVPIGRPIANTTGYVLARDLSPTPDGVAGELYVGGDGLALGYLDRPELTEERFLLSPFHDDDSARLYRTGDVVRRLPDGNIEFIGRHDNQIKLRGFRVELGEIEAALVQQPDVREAVVLCREDRPGDKRLVGYVVAQGEPAPSHSDLRVWLGEKLPAQMIPPKFVFLDALPLNPNGKVDRARLPAPDPHLQRSTYVAPRNESESRMAEIWSALLKTDRVGMNDDFFDLGGHSLLAMQLISRVRDLFGVEIPLQCLFERLSVAELVLRLDELRSASSTSHNDSATTDLEDYVL